MKKNIICLLALVLIGCAAKQFNSVTAEQASKMSIDDLNTAIVQDPGNVNLHLARANYFERNKSLDFAQEEYKIVLAKKPNDADVELQYANFLCNRKYDVYSAGVFYTKAIKESDVKIQAQAYSDYADCLIASDNGDNASELYLKSLSYESPPLSAYVGIVNLYSKQGNYAIANYYASLYNGPTTKDSLDMQLTVLGKLIDSDSNIPNLPELKSKYNNLSYEYFDLTMKNFSGTNKYPMVEESATKTQNN